MNIEKQRVSLVLIKQERKLRKKEEVNHVGVEQEERNFSEGTVVFRKKKLLEGVEHKGFGVRED